MIAEDPDPAVRAHAAERAARVAGAADALAHAIDSDAAPRVREAALGALASRRDARLALHPEPPLPLASITRRLAGDEWTFVRSAAAAALTAAAPDPRIDAALEAALADRSASVREEVVDALAMRGDARAANGIRERLSDEHEALEVRLAAAKALAALCDRGFIRAPPEAREPGAAPDGDGRRHSDRLRGRGRPWALASRGPGRQARSALGEGRARRSADRGRARAGDDAELPVEPGMTMTEIKRVSPQEALELTKTGWTYVDVRSEPEFDAGHPARAFNVPIAHMTGGAMTPNPDFVSVMEKAFGKDAKIVVGCKAGDGRIAPRKRWLARGSRT